MTRRGFTLIELLLAAAMSALLLAGLWSLFSTYERLFSTGEKRVEQAQLARALMQQLSDDLHAAIPDVSPIVPGATAAVRRFGLFGTRQAIQVDVLQVDETRVPGEETGGDNTGIFSRQRVPQAPELHTVRYTFEEPSEAEDGGPSGYSGLVRRELDWETPAAEAETSPASRVHRESPSFSAGSEGLSIDDLLALGEPSGAVLVVPEVVGVDFRYFDGSGWSDQWNSLQRKSLPVAVEAVLRVKASGEPRRTAAGSRETEAGEPRQPATDALEIEPGEPRQAPPPSDSSAVHVHRVLVYLGSNALEQGPKLPEVGPRRLVAPVAAPLPPPVYHAPMPPPRLPAGRTRDAAPLADQWMRSGS